MKVLHMIACPNRYVITKNVLGLFDNRLISDLLIFGFQQEAFLIDRINNLVFCRFK